MATLVAVAAAIVAGIATMAAYISAVDIAGAAARSHAIGVAYQPPRGGVSVTEHAGLVTVTASVPAAIGTMRAAAIVPAEAR